MAEVMTANRAAEYVKDGMTIAIGGFGSTGVPFKLIEAIVKRDPPPRGLHLYTNDPGFPGNGVGVLVDARCLRKISLAFAGNHPGIFEQQAEGKLEIEIMPEGTLAERFRAGGSGIGGVLTQVGLGTEVEEGKPKVHLDGQEYIVERPVRADVGLVRAHKADRRGNLIYHRTARNFNPVVATCSDFVIAEVDEIVEVGGLDPDQIITPFVYVNVLVKNIVRRWGRFVIVQ